MKQFILAIVLFLSLTLSSQTGNEKVNHFISIFKEQLKQYNAGETEEHYDQGYVKIKSASKYFESGQEIGLSSIYLRCADKSDEDCKKEIGVFFEQLLKLKTEREELAKKIESFDFAKTILKVRIYPSEMRAVYEKNNAIVKENLKGLIEVVVLDLTTGIGSLEKKYLAKWRKTEDEIYALAKANTVNSLHTPFFQADKDNPEVFVMADDYDAFVTSGIFDLAKSKITLGKCGTFVAVPNNSSVIALKVDDPKIVSVKALTFMGMVNYLYTLEGVKPVSDNVFWYNGKEILLVEKDMKEKKLIFPKELEEKTKQ